MALGGGAPVPVPLADNWVALETRGAYTKGDIIQSSSLPLPPGSVLAQDRAVGIFNNTAVVVGRLPPGGEYAIAREDLRVLPLRVGTDLVRHRAFFEAVPLMDNTDPQHGGIPLQGPKALFWFLQALASQTLTPSTHHEDWLRTARIPDGDRSIYEHECLSRILDAMISTDQLNAPALLSAELIGRRLAVIKEAHRLNPSTPDYTSADVFMGWQWNRNGATIAPDLSQHVATRLKAQADVAKEARKAKEEIVAARAKAKGKAKKTPQDEE